jgi:uncharacterized protein (TIGR02246 family)
MDQPNTAVPGQQQAKIDPSLEKTVDAFTEAFNRFDAKAVASFWAEDGTLLNPIGHYGRGRAGVEKVFSEDAQRLLAGSTSKFTVRTARPVGSDCVLADCDHEVRNCRMPDGTTGTMMLHLVVLAQRQGGEWKWLDARPYAFLRQEQVH